MPELFVADKKPIDESEIGKLVSGNRFKSVWGSLVVEPDFKFESQHEDEKIIILGRRHFITNFGWIAIVCFAFFVPLFWGEFPMINALDQNTTLFVSIAWYSGLAFYAMQSFLLWFYNVYIVTNERVVDVDFTGLLSKSVNVAPLAKIEDVNYFQKGMLSSMFDFGNVVVETASDQKAPDLSSESGAFTFESISNPDKVASVISELMEKEQNEHPINN
jgi:uncharacterized membrane protein YdbT with pleckstrin-like domain